MSAASILFCLVSDSGSDAAAANDMANANAYCIAIALAFATAIATAIDASVALASPTLTPPPTIVLADDPMLSAAGLVFFTSATITAKHKRITSISIIIISIDVVIMFCKHVVSIVLLVTQLLLIRVLLLLMISPWMQYDIYSKCVLEQYVIPFPKSEFEICLKDVETLCCEG